MKELVTANDIMSFAQTGKTTMYVVPGTIITPAARDATKEYGINIVENSSQQLNAVMEAPPVKNISTSTISNELIAQIVKEVLASLTNTKPAGLAKESDPSGLRLVKGNTVQCEKVNTGTPNNNVYQKEILTNKESPNLGIGFMTIDNSSHRCYMENDQTIHIIEGALEVTVNGNTFRGEAGDVFFLPRNTTVTLYTEEKVKYFFVSCLVK